MSRIKKSPMSDIAEKVEGMLDRIEDRFKSNQEQFALYEKLIQQGIENNREKLVANDQRLDMFDKRIARLVNIMITLVTVVIVPAFMAAVSMQTQINQLPTVELLEKSYMNKNDSFNAMGSLVDSDHLILLEIGWTKEDADIWRTDKKREILEIYGIKFRNASK